LHTPTTTATAAKLANSTATTRRARETFSTWRVAITYEIAARRHS
jgi:hypothetical protein